MQVLINVSAEEIKTLKEIKRDSRRKRHCVLLA